MLLGSEGKPSNKRFRMLEIGDNGFDTCLKEVGVGRLKTIQVRNLAVI